MLTFLAFGVVAACGKVGATPGSDSGLPTDGAPAACDVTKPFGTAVEVPGLHDPTANDTHATLTDDELTVYFASDRANVTAGTLHIYSATRATRTAAFGAPGQVGSTFSDNGDSNPSISPDGNTIVFDSLRPPTSGLVHLFMATRTSAAVVFPQATLIPGDSILAPSLSPDGNVIYAASLGSGGLVRFDKAGVGFGAAQMVALPFGNSVTSPVTRDDLTLFLALGEGTGTEILVSKRASTSSPWSMPTTVTELKTAAVEAEPSWLSADGCRLYLRYKASANGRSTIFVATRPN